MTVVADALPGFEELAPPLTEREALVEADRCLECGVRHAPAPCLVACPASVDVPGFVAAIEAVGVPETFELCAELIRPLGRVANVGVHGCAATLHLEKLWIRNVTITTGLVDTFATPRLLQLVESGRLDPTPFGTHRFALDETMAAYDVFADAANTHALKVVLSAHPVALPAASGAAGAEARTA